MEIQVTDEDIKLGEPWCDPWNPVARAIRRHLPQALSVKVWQDCIVVDGQVMNCTIRLRQFIENFDYGVEVCPFSFVLDLKESSIPKDSYLVKRLHRIYSEHEPAVPWSSYGQDDQSH